MSESTSFAPLYPAAIIYGVRPGSEVEAEAAFREQVHAYRERFERAGTALTQDEAVEAYRLVAPLCQQSPDPDEAEYRAVVLRHTYHDKGTGRICLAVKRIEDLLASFEAEHDGGGPVLEILADPWERYFRLKCLLLLVNEDLTLYPDATIRALIARTVPILARERPVTRPRGKHNPAIRECRDMFIEVFLEKFAGCGLPVTARGGGDSLAGAMAEAIGVSESIIMKVWRVSPLRDSQFNDELPAELRMRESLTRTPREYFAVDVRCADCGQAGKVPKHRAGKGESRVCLSCLPLDGSLPPTAELRLKHGFSSS